MTHGNQEGSNNTYTNGNGTQLHFGSLAVHAGTSHDATTGAVIAPISLSTTFAQSSPANPIGEYEYSRSSNPNRDEFEKAVAQLEIAETGITKSFGLAFSSGSAATGTILQAIAANGHVVSVSDVYGGTHRYLTKVASTHNIDVSFTTDILNDLDSLVNRDGPNRTKLVWIETPSNPTLGLTDIKAVAEKAHSYGLIVVVDNTFASPYVQQPLKFGADVVIHSGTKYLNGHSDVVIGVAVVTDDAIHQKLRFLQNALGAIPSPFDSWLAHRGLKTLHLRVRQASTSALEIARALEKLENVLGVSYPGLPNHKDYETIVLKQHNKARGGGMVSFRIRGGANAAAKFCQSTKIFTLAESLGGIESLCEVPAAMTHAGIAKQHRESSGVYDDLIRLSVGIEDTEDLINDVLHAIDVAAAAK